MIHGFGSFWAVAADIVDGSKDWCVVPYDESDSFKQPKRDDQDNGLTCTVTMYAQERRKLPIKTTENRT